MYRDLRDGWRQWRRTPVVTLAALSSLALAIGANATIFTLLNALMLKPLAVSAPERLALITDAEGSWQNRRISEAAWRALDDSQDLFESVAAFAQTSFDIAGPADPSRLVPGLHVSGSYFGLLGLAPARGRLFDRRDDEAGADARIAVISYQYWRSALGGARDVVGRVISVDRQPFTIVGVLPQHFFGLEVGRTFHIAVPIAARALIEADYAAARSYWLGVVGRLRADQTLASASSRIALLHASLSDSSGDTFMRDRPWSLRSIDAVASPAQRSYAPVLFLLIAIVGAVLLIACVNLANLLLARGAVRSRELAIRMSLGAARKALLRQLIVEACLMAAIGSVLGGGLGWYGSHALIRLLSADAQALFLDVTPDVRVIAFLIGTSLVTALLFGVLPAIRATSLDPVQALAGRRFEHASRFSLGHVLLGAQVTLTFVLVFAAIALLRTLTELTTQSIGFERDRVVIADIDFSRSAARAEAGVVSNEARRLQVEQVRSRLASIPGVEGASLMLVAPFGSGAYASTAHVEGFTPQSPDDSDIYYSSVDEHYFRVMGIPLLAGRAPRGGAGAGVREAVVTEAFVRRFLAGKPAVGVIFGYRPERRPTQIVGVVPDIKFRTLRGPSPAFVYFSWASETRPLAFFQVGLRVSPGANVTEGALAAANEVPGLGIRLTSLDERVDATIVRERLSTGLSALLAGLALLLAAIGLYGVLSYHVVRRTKEIGIRMAVGATRSHVRRLVLSQVTALTFASLVAGTALAQWAGRFVLPLLYNVSTTDPFVMLGAGVVLASTALTAGYLPASRAARINPMEALRRD